MINIRLSCLAGILDNRNYRNDQVAKQIEANALNAWQNRQPTETTVRFLSKMNEGLFRFLHVTQQPNGSLLVYR